MKVFITSNQQFGRQHALSQSNRDFSSVEAMDDYMIEQWNSVVKPEDTVYVLGSFAWDPETAEDVVKALNGNIIILPNIWDQASRDIVERYGKELGVAVIDDGIKYIKFLQVCISYWPLSEWPAKEEGSISVIGLYNDNYKTDHKARRINVAADYWDFKPVNITEVITLFKDPDIL